MKRSKWRTALKVFAGLIVVGYVAIALIVVSKSGTAEPRTGTPASVAEIAVFGASGTAGDGILKAALASDDVQTIHVITRRTTPRMQAGIDAGKVIITSHMDYLDYAAIVESLADVDAVFWALGTSSLGMDEAPYRRIHIDFPRRFVEQWLPVSRKPEATFHYISSSDISEDASAMWARVKAEAEIVLFEQVAATRKKVIAWRPDYIGPTVEEAHLGQNLLYWFFRPLGAAVRAEQIGNAMIEVAIRRNELSNGAKVGTWRIWELSDAYVN